MKILKKLKHILPLLFVLISIGIAAQIPAGYYYIADGKRKNELKSYLSVIISQMQPLNYGSGEGRTWQGFYYADRNPDNSVIDMYSPIVRYFPENYGSISGMHIEHSLPKSWWGGRQNNAYRDLFHLYPADGVTNSTKSNLPLGEVYSATFNNGMTKVGLNGFSYYIGRVFEPADEFKGDFARSYLYMSVAYENFGILGYWQSPMMNNNTYPVWQKWAIDLLLKWHRQDPVSEKERTRQKVVFQIQGNRNPFIDFPDLVEYIWGTDTNNIYRFPVETQPFMVRPTRWDKIDFGVVMQSNQDEGKQFQIWGRNITGNINLSIKNASPALELSQSVVTAAQANASRTINIWLNAQNTGSVIDTLVISGGGLANTIYVPINAIISPDFMVLRPAETTTTTASLAWMNDFSANSYTIRVFRNTAKSSDLFFSGYIEGSSWNKGFVIYNNTGRNIDLSKYNIKKQTNGTGDFRNELKLIGTLADGQKYALVHSSAAQSLRDIADKVVSSTESTIMSFDGNDAIALYHNGVMIDMIGIENDPIFWGQNLSLRRKYNIIHPTTEFSFDEWDILPIDDFSPAVSHSAATFSDVLFNEYSTSPSQNNFITITNLSPQTQYIYEVRANRQPISSSITSVNRMAFRTKPLEIPFALEATDIDETSFTANWEDVEGAQGYRLDVFQATASETEGFDGMSGTTNYPSGWSGNGNASYYTSVANSGQNIPSFSFTTNNRWLQTKTYHAPVAKLSFWYRFPTGANSNLIVQGNKGGTEWFDIQTINQQNTAAQTAIFNFDTEDNFKAFKFTLNKPTGGGNLALDDVSVEFDTTYILQNQIVNGTNYWINNLTLGETYFYRVKSYYQTIMSNFSDEISVTTQIPPCIFDETLILQPEDLPYTWHNAVFNEDVIFEVGTTSGNYMFERISEDACDTIVYLNLIIGSTDIKETAENQTIIYSTKDGIYINNIKNGDKITIYTTLGVPIYQTIANSDQIFIPMQQKGIFIVMVNNKAFKMVK